MSAVSWSSCDGRVPERLLSYRFLRRSEHVEVVERARALEQERSRGGEKEKREAAHREHACAVGDAFGSQTAQAARIAAQLGQSAHLSGQRAAQPVGAHVPAPAGGAWVPGRPLSRASGGGGGTVRGCGRGSHK